MGRGTFGEVRNGSLDPRGSQGRIGGTSRRSWTGRGTLGEVQDVVGGAGRVGGPLGRTGTGEGTIPEVKRPSASTGTDRRTFREVRVESGDPRGGPAQVGVSPECPVLVGGNSGSCRQIGGP